MEKKHFLELIQSNIDQYGFHLTTVNSPVVPRFAYTIGLYSSFGFELILPGGIIFLKEDLFLIVNTIVEKLKVEKHIINRNITVPTLGSFSFSPIDSSWSKLMMLGIFDYYKINDIDAFQIIPDCDHYTLDIPNMANEWDISIEPVWQWLVRKWNYNIPEDSTAVTNINAMLGESITEVMRWENDGWEMFAGVGSEVDEKDVRVVSLGTIIGIDKTLLPVIDLDIGKGLWRDTGDSSWNNWE